MSNKYRGQKILVLLGLMLVLVIGACTPRPGGEPAAGDSPTETPNSAENEQPTPTANPEEPVSSEDPTPVPEPTTDEGHEDVLIEDAVIKSVQIMIMESWPLQAAAQVEGELGDGCTTLGPITKGREGNTFRISVKTTRPAEAVCTQILQTFSETITLDIEGLQAGTYTVDVNGVRETFTLEQDNVMEPEPTETAEEGALSREDKAELVRLTLERALLDEEIPDYGLLPDPENVVLSTENVDAELVPDLPGVTLVLLTPSEIQTRADENGDFLYLRFDEISAESPQKAMVSLSNTWAVADDSDTGYLSGGGFTIEYTKDAGDWSGEIIGAWIS